MLRRNINICKNIHVHPNYRREICILPHQTSFAKVKINLVTLKQCELSLWKTTSTSYYSMLLFSCLVVSDSVIPWTAAHQASLFFTFFWGLLRFMSIESVMHAAISSSVSPFSSHLPSFLASGSFPMSRHFASVGQNIGASASASVLPMNIQGWFPLEFDWFDPLAVQESSLAPLFKGINSLMLNIFYCPALTSIHDYWKNHSFVYMDLCWKSNVSAS